MVSKNKIYGFENILAFLCGSVLYYVIKITNQAKKVIVIDENFGVRIISLVSTEERIKSLR